MKIEIVAETKFASQFRSICLLDDMSVVLGGGLDPQSGSRSAFRAELCRLDHNDSKVWWSTTQKSRHYSQIAVSGQTILGLLPHNFTRTPAGAFLYDLETGAHLSTTEIVGPLTVTPAANDSFIVSVQDDEIAKAILLKRNQKSELFSLQPPVAHDLLSTCQISERLILSTWSVANDRAILYEHRAMSLETKECEWLIRSSKNDQVIIANEILAAFPSEGKCNWLEFFQTDDGSVAEKMKINDTGIVRLQMVGDRKFVWANHHSELVVFDANTRKTSRTDLSNDHPGWIDFSASADGHIAVILTNNYQNPETRLVRCVVDW